MSEYDKIDRLDAKMRAAIDDAHAKFAEALHRVREEALDQKPAWDTYGILYELIHSMHDEAIKAINPSLGVYGSFDVDRIGSDNSRRDV